MADFLAFIGLATLAISGSLAVFFFVQAVYETHENVAEILTILKPEPPEKD